MTDNRTTPTQHGAPLLEEAAVCLDDAAEATMEAAREQYGDHPANAHRLAREQRFADQCRSVAKRLRTPPPSSSERRDEVTDQDAFALITKQRDALLVALEDEIGEVREGERRLLSIRQCRIVGIPETHAGNYPGKHPDRIRTAPTGLREGDRS